MEYLLILQFTDSSPLTYDTVVELENRLIETFGSRHEVDGHDSGEGEINVFILTNDPLGAFEESLVLARSNILYPSFRAAYRRVDGENFSVLWPKEFQGTFSVA